MPSISKAAETVWPTLGPSSHARGRTPVCGPVKIFERADRRGFPRSVEEGPGEEGAAAEGEISRTDSFNECAQACHA